MNSKNKAHSIVTSLSLVTMDIIVNVWII